MVLSTDWLGESGGWWREGRNFPSLIREERGRYNRRERERQIGRQRQKHRLTKTRTERYMGGEMISAV